MDQADAGPSLSNGPDEHDRFPGLQLDADLEIKAQSNRRANKLSTGFQRVRWNENVPEGNLLLTVNAANGHWEQQHEAATCIGATHNHIGRSILWHRAYPIGWNSTHAAAVPPAGSKRPERHVPSFGSSCGRAGR